MRDGVTFWLGFVAGVRRKRELARDSPRVTQVYLDTFKRNADAGLMGGVVSVSVRNHLQMFSLYTFKM